MLTSDSFCRRLIESCETHSDRTAMRVIGLPEETYTYGRMLSEIRSVASQLRSAGVEKGDRVAVIGENHPCWAVAYLATLYADAVCVPIDPHGETGTVANFLEDSEAKLAFLSESALERFSAVEERLGRPVRKVVWRSSGEGDFTRIEDWTSEPADPDAPAPEAAGDDNALLIYTSGTTGRPKGVLLTHGNICAELDAVDRILEVAPEERILSLLPLFHAYLQIAALWIASTKGCEVIYLKSLSPDELAGAMKESRMTIFASVPRVWYLFHKKIFDEVRGKGKAVATLFRMLLRANGLLRDLFRFNLGRLFFGRVHDSFGGQLRLAIAAGSRFDEDVAKDFHRMGFTIVQAYGLTETSGAATATAIDDNRVGSVGKPVLGAEVKIAGSGNGSEGEVLIKGPMVFGGYYRNPEATAEAFDEDGWFRSGDLGKFDRDGHLYITGRAKDVIVLPSGKNVHPEDLEVHYLRSPLVTELCVIGIEDETEKKAGAEKLAAVAVPDFEYLKAKGIANAREAIRFELDGLGRELPEYQRVRDYIIRTEPLPRTATNKIKRFELRKEIVLGGSANETEGNSREWTFSEQDRELMDSPAGKTVKHTLLNGAGPEAIHPDMNLEIDLRLDSLARAEAFARLEHHCGFEFSAEQVAGALKVRDVVALVTREGSPNAEAASKELNWGSILGSPDGAGKVTRAVLKDRPLFSLAAFLVLKCFYLFCKVFLSLKVEGRENLKKPAKPFLICPNHQSYLDAFVVCSTYPYSVLKDIFHVGASEYFEGPVTRRLASLLNVVPIDPDTHLLKAMKAGAAGLKQGKILNIYPEGERAFDGRLHAFKDGAAILSAELGVPIVPVALDGLHKVWARGSRVIRPARVTIRFGAPIEPPAVPSNGSAADYRSRTSLLKSEVSKMLDDIRG